MDYISVNSITLPNWFFLFPILTAKSLKEHDRWHQWKTDRQTSNWKNCYQIEKSTVMMWLKATSSSLSLQSDWLHEPQSSCWNKAYKRNCFSRIKPFYFYHSILSVVVAAHYKTIAWSRYCKISFNLNDFLFILLIPDIAQFFSWKCQSEHVRFFLY